MYERIRRRLDVLGLSDREASLRASGRRNPDLIRSLKSGRNHAPRGASLVELARVLEVTPEWLIGAEGGSDEPPPRRSTTSEPVAVDFDSSTLPVDIPVLGVAAGGAEGAFVIDGEIDRVRRPPALRLAKNVYALYVRGVSMEPRFRAGDLLFVSPDRPAASGDDVIIQTRNHDGAPTESWLKTLDHFGSEEIVVRQLNPEKILRFESAKVIAVHRVLTLRELFGA